MKKIALLLVLLFHFTLFSYANQDVMLFQGEWKGSKILIAEPMQWNKHLLILAHEYRKSDTPLTAEFEYDNKFFKPLIDQGWMIASTSYRINGIAFTEGYEDVGFLRTFVVEKYGRPDKIFVRGQSMGGSIAVWIAEKQPGDYTGVLSIDPAIRKALKFTREPAIPILFLCNQNEVEPVKGYIAGIGREAVKPALWIVQRDGHLNINPEEKAAAFDALVDFAAGKPISMEHEILMIPEDKLSTAEFKDGGAYSKVIRIHPTYGNVDTEFTPADLEKLGIAKGEIFTVGFGDKKYKVLLGTTFKDVPKGEWIAFFKEDGLLKIARNFDSAVDLLGCKEGDKIFINQQ